jgi:muramoyltetrapeptide carboxypeptidase
VTSQTRVVTTLRSPVLEAGDRVRLLSPASTPDPEWLRTSFEILESWGLVVEVGAHASDRWGYMAGRDEDRLADLNEAFRDPLVRAIITTRGGAGAYRIADGIDFDAVRADPKPVVGFSDVTYLHLALWHHCRLAAIHGALAGTTASATVRQLLMSTEPVILRRDPAALSAAVRMNGTATGPLVGGNLTAIGSAPEAALGCFDGAVLFVEGPRTIGLGQVDRALTHLMRTGALNGVRGVALGLFEGFDGFTDRGWNLIDVLTDRLGALDVPVLGGVFAGHGGIGPDGRPDQSALPLGTTATLDADAGTMTVQPCVERSTHGVSRNDPG